jgi:hypothetical protein
MEKNFFFIELNEFNSQLIADASANYENSFSSSFYQKTVTAKILSSSTLVNTEIFNEILKYFGLSRSQA